MAKSIQKIIILFLLLLLFRNSYPQQYFTRTYTIKDGLPTRNVNSACQDKDGIIWFATNYGVSKYDGFSFTNFGISDGLPDQQYKSIKIDTKGILWVIPSNSVDTIVFLKDNFWYKIQPVDATRPNHPNTSFDIIYKNDRPVICVGSNDGFYVYEKNVWTHFPISENPQQIYVYTVVAKNNKFYLSTKRGLGIFENGKTDFSLTDKIKAYGDDILAINFENKNLPDEKLWILNEKWIGFIRQDTFTMVSTKFQLPRTTVSNYAYLDIDKAGNIYFGNIWSKYYVDKSSDIPVPLMVRNGFTSDGATSIFIDREQNVWFTDTRGISKINNLKIKNYLEKNGMRENEVSAIIEMNDGRIVLGHNRGLSILNPDYTFKTLDFPAANQSNKRVLEMMKDNEGNIWFVSIGLGLGRLLPDGSITWYNLGKNTATTAVMQDKNGRIWIGADAKLFYLEGNKFVEYKVFKEGYNSIRRIFSDGKNGIYVAGFNGLWHIHDDKAKKTPSPPDKKADNVYAYLKDKKGIEYIGTIHGLYTIENKQIIKFKKKGIEINNPVFFIIQDKAGMLWIGSDKGVYKWDGESKIEIYNTNNGLVGWETNRGAGMCDSKGRVWIGTDRGLSCFEPGFDKTTIPVPLVNLLYTEDSRGIQHVLTGRSTIKNNDNTLSFHFRGISFFNEELIEYRYKLEGFDEEWQEISQPMLGKVKYIGLNAGTYTFCVMARNFSGKWSEISRSEPIYIEQPFYFKWWFLFLVFIVLGGIIYGTISIYIQRLQNSRLEKEIIERKRVEQALEDSRQKYRDLVQLLPETIYETDFSGKIVYLNNTGLKLFGYEPADLKKDFYIDQLISPDSQEEIRSHIESLFGYTKANKGIMRAITKSGNIFPISIHSVPIMLNNKCVGTRGIIIDLTEQKQYEDKLQKNAEDLQALNHSKDMFFSIIAHDLRSPFTTFLGFTEILDEEIDSLPKNELHNIVTYMRSSALNLYQLLENLLEWSLFHREITSFGPENVRLLTVVQNCAGGIADTSRLKDLDLKIEIPEDIMVEADVHMLQTIIRNLLSNAIKFTSRGGSVKVSASETEDNRVKIAISDTGIGIKPEMLEKIFLFNTNNKTKGTEGELSTGLGLILCKEFVEKHGGKIWVDSEENKGSTFSFTIGRGKV